MDEKSPSRTCATNPDGGFGHVIAPTDRPAPDGPVNGGRAAVHPLMRKPQPMAPLEFEIPRAATASGELRLTWYGEAGLGGNGRGCQVAEVWVMRE